MSRGVSGRGDPRFLIPQYEGVAPAAYPAWRTKVWRTKVWRIKARPVKAGHTKPASNAIFKAHQMAINLVPA